MNTWFNWELVCWIQMFLFTVNVDNQSHCIGAVFNPSIKDQNLMTVYEAVEYRGLRGFIMPLFGPNLCTLLKDNEKKNRTTTLLPDMLLDVVNWTWTYFVQIQCISTNFSFIFIHLYFFFSVECIKTFMEEKSCWHRH